MTDVMSLSPPTSSSSSTGCDNLVEDWKSKLKLPPKDGRIKTAVGSSSRRSPLCRT